MNAEDFRISIDRDLVDRITAEHIAQLIIANSKMREALEYYKDAVKIDDSECECGQGSKTSDDGIIARKALGDLI